MPPRKRRTRRTPDILPDLEPTPAPALEPAPLLSGPVPPHTEVAIPPVLYALDPRTGRATQEVSEDGHVFSRRPGDAWRDRMLCVWSPRDSCPACGNHRVVLAALTGEAGVCDLLADIAYLASMGWCTCAYAPQEA